MADRARWIDYVPLDDLIPADENPNVHFEEKIDESIEAHGLVETIVVDDRTGKMVAGHGRRNNLLVRRARGGDPPEGVEMSAEGVWIVPLLRGWASRDDDEAERYLLASNIGPNYDPGGLAEILGRLQASPTGLAGTGHTDSDLDALLASLDAGQPEPSQPEDEVPAGEWLPPPQLCRVGDLFELGPHRLIVGDCRNRDDVARLVDGRRIGLAFTSPPYADRRVYDEASDFRPVAPADYVDWFASVSANVAEHLAADGSWVVNIRAGADGLDKDTYCLDLVLAHVREWGWHWAEEFCWERAGMPLRPARRLKNQFEPIYQFTRGEWKWHPERLMHQTDAAIYKLAGVGETNWAVTQGIPGSGVGIAAKKRKKPMKGSNAKNQGTNVEAGEAVGEGMAYPGNRLPSFAGTHEATGHPAAFPRGLASWFITLLTDEGDVVFDPFAGSGSTLIAAHDEGRIGLVSEISPSYCDVICKRFEAATGIVPVRDGIPISFSEPHGGM